MTHCHPVARMILKSPPHQGYPLQSKVTVWLLGIILLPVLLSGLTACSQANPLSAMLMTPVMPVESPVVDLQPSPEVETGSGATPFPSPSPTPSPTPSPMEWVWTANSISGDLLVIDPASNSIAVIIPTGHQPDIIAPGEGAVWALDRTTDQVLRFNQTTYQMEAVISIPQGETTALACGEGGVWVGIEERPLTSVLRPYEEYIPNGGVIRIDPGTSQVNGYAEVGSVIRLTTGLGYVWAITRNTVDTPLYRINPQTLQRDEISLHGTHDWLLEDAIFADDESLWMFSQGFARLYRMNPEGRLYSIFSLRQQKPIGYADLRSAYGSLWLATPWGDILQFDPSTGAERSRTSLRVPLQSITAAAGSIWVHAPADGAVYRLDAQNGEVQARIETGEKLPPTPVVTATPIQRATRPCEDAPYSRLQVGMRAFTLKEPDLPQRLHKEPGKESERVGWIQPGETVTILEGPTCAEGWVWWKVRTERGGYTGWAAEGDENEYFLNPLR
ncbi:MULTISPECIES: SH3 domain-containing protein [Anaerolinea]|uniref:SH3 domain-containing protein n=1 Tax=Anaerolinea TaxID=233189 RepID=UPI0026386393|nr:SH3 domain-containing protein [Anaerolinea thermophila]